MTEKQQKKTRAYALAILLIVVGIVGLFLPLIPGTALIVAGLIVLSTQSQQLESFIDKVLKNKPHIKSKANSYKEYVRKKLK